MSTMRNVRTKRKSEIWISHNRVLVGGGNKKSHVRNPNFETEETKLLISLWGDPKVQKTLVTSHKKFPIIVKLSEEMQKHGYFRTPEEINTRLKNLKCFYNRIKKGREVGSVHNSTWKHFDSMDEILSRPIFGNPVVLADENSEDNMSFKFDADDSRDLRPEDLLSVETSLRTDDCKEEDLINIKDEPIDLEDQPEAQQTEAESSKITNEIPKLIPRYSWLQQSSQRTVPSFSTSTNNVVCINPATSLPNHQLDAAQKAKISLVPTNFLLKPPNSNHQTATKTPFYLPNNTTINSFSTITTNSQNKVQNSNSSSGTSMPMKVLVVNRMPPTTQNPPELRSKAPESSTSTEKLESGPPGRRKRSFRGQAASEATMLGIQTMVKQLISAQKVSNELSQKRLEFEREKWETQKTFYTDLHTLVPFVKRVVSSNCRKASEESEESLETSEKQQSNGGEIVENGH